MKIEKLYTNGEEVFNSLTHGIGTMLSAAGTTLLIILSLIYGNTLGLVSSIIYGITLILMFASSTLYHSLPNEKAKKIFRVFDHCSIFLLIAGTYTPFTLITLGRDNGIILFSVIWISAIIGVILNAVDLKKYDKLSLVCYVLMGWAAIFAVRPLIRILSPIGILLLILGGIMYTGGIIFYKMKNKYMHSVWHLFVLAGAVLHFFTILIYVLPTTF